MASSVPNPPSGSRNTAVPPQQAVKVEECTTESKPSGMNPVLPEVAVKEEAKPEPKVQPEGLAGEAPKLGVKPEAGTGADDEMQDVGVEVGLAPSAGEHLGEAGPVNMEEAAPVNMEVAGLDEGGAQPANQPGGGVPVTVVEVERVQAMIESCLQLYMSKHEVINILLSQANIQQEFTELVWQKLEEQNPDFFRAYYTRLKLKDQIILFNHILQQQMDQCAKQGVAARYSGTSVMMGGERPGMVPMFHPPQPRGMVHMDPGAAVHPPTTTAGGCQSPSQGVDFGMPEMDHQTGLPRTNSDLSLGVFNIRPPCSPLRDNFLHDDGHDLQGLPRNFSLSDLGLIQEEGGGMGGMGGQMLGADLGDLPRAFSMGELAQMDMMPGSADGAARPTSSGGARGARAATPGSPGQLLTPRPQGSDGEARLVVPPRPRGSPSAPAGSVPGD